MRHLLVLAAFLQAMNGATTLDLIPAKPGARTGTVAIRSTGYGLLIEGKVNGPAPDFATSPAAMATKDHVEIWLAAASDPVLPATGWGNQFGMMTCKTEELSDEQRAKCAAFEKQMAPYRVRFRRLFVRQYQVTPGVAAETFATQAFTEITTKYPKKDTASIAILKPSGAAPAMTAKPDAAGYSFEVRVPWSALPPVNALKLDRVRVMVDVFSASTYSTTSPTRKYGEPASFHTITLDTPHTSKITTCDFPLKARDLYADEFPSWYLPSESRLIQTTFIIQNAADGYRYDPEGLSPVAIVKRYFQKDAAPGKTVCGPDLAFANGSKVHRLEYEVDEKTLDTRVMADGSVLIKSGPAETLRSPFGSGQCGSCTVVSLSLYRATPAGIEEAFDATETLDAEENSPSEMRFQLTPDWSKVTVFRRFELKQNRWNLETHCLEGTKYKLCETKKGVPKPK